MSDQNQHITATTITTNANGETYRPLSALLAERRRERAEIEAQQKRARAEKQQRIAREATDYAEEWMQRHISRELCAALRATPTYDPARITDSERPDDITPEEWAASILLDLSGAPEIDPNATPDQLEEGRWQIRRTWNDDGARWEVYHAQQDWRFGLWPIVGDVCADEDILDALNTYPVWLRHP